MRVRAFPCFSFSTGHYQITRDKDGLLFTVLSLCRQHILYLSILYIKEFPLRRKDDKEGHLLFACPETGQQIIKFAIVLQPLVQIVKFGENHDTTSFPSNAGTITTPSCETAWKNRGSAVSRRPLFDSIILPVLSSR